MLRLQLGLAGQGDDAALVGLFNRDLGAKARQHPLGMVAGGLGLDHHGFAGGIQPGQQHCGFDLRRRHRHGVAHWHRLGRADQRHRQAAPGAAHGLRAEQRQRVSHPRHRAAVEAGIAREGDRDRRGRHRPHQQPHAGAGIAAVDHIVRLGKAADTHPVHGIGAAAVVDDLGPESAHGFGGVEHVLPLQKPGDRGLAHGHGAKDQAAVRDRLVAGHFGGAAKRPAGAR